MAKKIEKKRAVITTAAEPSAAAQTTAGAGECGAEGVEGGLPNATEPTHSEMDKGGEAGAAAAQGVSSEIERIAMGTFARMNAEVLYFTADRQGFARRMDAQAHASKLSDNKITVIKRKL